MDFTCAKLPPNSTQNIPIYFHPSKAGLYKIYVPFLVSQSKLSVKILGEGVRINIQLVNAKDQYIDLGKMKVGTSRKHVLQIMNKTPTHLETSIGLWDSFASHKVYKEEVKTDMKMPVILPANKGFVS